MGFSPVEVDKMSLWQLVAAAEGYADAHTPEKERAMSIEEFDEISKMLDEA